MTLSDFAIVNLIVVGDIFVIAWIIWTYKMLK